ncbi:DNA helicase/exodeoxyribonuclease V, subunit A [Sporobacter termitidis DSM 10068]|uniref:DNA 3'-5' helicase n=1 Tax=Sporobacter termitidis DSM 10068 TaxID=1123282 RepID=A0A1M5X636_9FIRM|nr:helicase-exonuclease AddAB subunit AddA [Sporobacter termitidis]SHH95285.1 DNA helicase/exodeoxyribonuclease V, subunit A [Sporobacter termitidis DSM 10068]
MSGISEFTPRQLAAIETRGGALLVSAAAGSGKTRVLVERLLRYVSGREDSCDVTDFLIITYTRAAASELRSRILDELSEKLALEPDNRHLRRQAALVYEASIGTIHGFCTDILRENAHLAGLTPDFRVADESEAAIMKDKVLEDLLDRRYETVAETPGFALLVDTMSAGRDDKRLKEIVLETYAKLQSHAAPQKWAEEQLEALDTGALRDASETVWGRFLMDDARKKALYWRGVMRRLRSETTAHPDFEKAYGDSIGATLDGLELFASALSRTWDEARGCANVDFPRAKNVKGYEDLKEIRTKCRDALKKLAAVFECASEGLLEDMAAVRPAVTELLKLVLEFDKAYAEAKKKRGLVDFSDLEHLAARVLTDFETGAPTETALAVSRRYREIMVDEYQDVSRVQELIFNAVSRGGENIFMVGDVKQSIYRFRLADPTIFLAKYKSYKDAEEAEPGEGRRVLLSTNFRSRAGVLEAVNHVFKNVMSEDFGEMAYTEREFLYPGRTDGESPEPAVELDVLDMRGIETEEDEESPEKTAVEADFIAARIAEMLQSGTPVPDGKGGTRPVACGDFAILLRSVKDKAALYEKALADRDIPAALPGGEGFFASLEVSVTLSLLGVIDNPMQDIPLIAVLRSPVYGFTPDELAVIRAADKSADFYGALVKAAETNDKCRAFLDALASFRLIAPDMPADRFIWHVFNKTDMLAVMGALRGGGGRRSNLMRLVELAVRCEAGGYKGLFGFMTLVRKLMEKGEEPFGSSETPSGDAVKIMSIHKSKGLEFPVVFLADTTKRFNKKDAAAPLLIHAALGVGAKRTDLMRRIEYPTLARMAVARKLNQEMLSEELRVLYVAMTRAREKLVVVSTFADADKELLKLSKDAVAPVAPQVLENAAGMASLVLLPALTRPEAECLRLAPVPLSTDCGAPWDIRKIVITEAPAARRRKALPAEPHIAARAEDVAALRRNLDYQYPYIKAAEIPSKLTATGLKGRFADFEAAEEAAQLHEAARHRPPAERPAFITRRTALTPSERGTALHLAMQFIDYDKCGDLESVREELRRLREKSYLSAKQADAVDPAKLLAFFDSPLGKRVMGADRLYREFKFSLLVRADAYFADGGDDELLFQGVVDCCFEEGGALHVIDFKTDHVTPETVAEKTRLYAPQLTAYARAMERIVGLPVRSRLIYFFALDAVAEVE